MVLKISPHSADAERGIHEARTDSEEQEAFQELEQLIPREPKNADLHTTYAEELLERNRNDEAKDQATYSLKLDKQQWHAYGVLGQVAMSTGDSKTARANLEMAIRHDPTDDDSLVALADIEIHEKNLTAAVKLLRQLVKVAPEESMGHTKLADALDLSGNADEAKRERATAAAIESSTKSKAGAQ